MDYGISLVIQKDIKIKGDRVGDYIVGENTVFYQLPYPFPCKFAVTFPPRRWCIYVTPWMLRLPTFLKYHNIDWLRQQIQQVNCVENGALLLHGAAWQRKGVGYLAVGFANSGKTTRILEEMNSGEYFPVDVGGWAWFCSDENVIVNSDGCLEPVVRATSVNRGQIRHYHLPLTMRARIGLLASETRSWLCPIFEPNIWITLPYERHSFKLNKLIYLAKGVQKGSSVESGTVLAGRLTSPLALLTDNEFPFYTNPVLQTYAYATGWDLDGIYAKYRKLIQEVEKCS